MKIRIDELECTQATQVRAKLSKEIIDQYCEDIKAGAIFPEIVAFAENGSERRIVSDGHHRVLAHVNAGLEEIEVDLREGGPLEALIFALGANAGHGLRRSNLDKKNAVKMALASPAIAKLSQQEIADICRVDRRTVGRISRHETLYRNGENGTKSHDKNKGDPTPGEPEENTPDNVRPTMPPPTQEMVDRDELRQAMSRIRAFPYSGDGTKKLGLSQADIANVNYCIDWLTEALEAFVAAQYKPEILGDSENRLATEQ